MKSKFVLGTLIRDFLFLVLKIFILFIIYLAAPGLSGSMWDLRFSLRHAIPLLAACRLLAVTYGI